MRLRDLIRQVRIVLCAFYLFCIVVFLKIYFEKKIYLGASSANDGRRASCCGQGEREYPRKLQVREIVHISTTSY